MRLAVASAAVAVIFWGLAGPAAAQEADGQKQDAAESDAAESTEGKDEDSGKSVEIVIDPDLDEEFSVVELALQIAAALPDEDGKEASLDSVRVLGLSVAETDRQKAYVHLRIAEMQYQRGDREAAIESLKEGLPLADGDRNKGSLYHKILLSLLTIYNEQGRLNSAEARPYVQIYREIIAANEADPWERLPGSKDVIHKPTGIRLPQKLGMFTRKRLIVFDETGRDAGATYIVDNSRFPLLTVYAVAGTGETAAAHFEGALGHVLARFKGAKLIGKGPYSVAAEKGTIEGFAAHVTVPAEAFGVEMGSDLYVFVREGTLIKFRITFRERNRTTIEDEMRKIFKSFDWP